MQFIENNETTSALPQLNLAKLLDGCRATFDLDFEESRLKDGYINQFR